MNRFLVRIVESRTLSSPDGGDYGGRQPALDRRRLVRIPHILTIPVPRGDEDCEFAQPRRQAAPIPQQCAGLLPFLEELRAVQRQLIRRADAADAAADLKASYTRRCSGVRFSTGSRGMRGMRFLLFSAVSGNHGPSTSIRKVPLRGPCRPGARVGQTGLRFTGPLPCGRTERPCPGTHRSGSTRSAP